MQVYNLQSSSLRKLLHPLSSAPHSKISSSMLFPYGESRFYPRTERQTGYSQFSESCPVLSQWSPGACVDSSDRCAVSHVIHQVPVWVSRWSYLVPSRPTTSVVTASDPALRVATPLPTHCRLHYPWYQAKITQPQSKPFHLTGKTSELIHTYLCTFFVSVNAH